MTTKDKPDMPRLHIRSQDQSATVTVRGGTDLLTALREAGFALEAPCGGRGTCGKCVARLNGTEVLACQATVTENADVEVRELRAPSAPAPSAEPRGRSLGAALDLGTTTLALELYELPEGRRVGGATAWNAQISYGADVISRIQYCKEHPEGTRTLSAVVRGQVEELLSGLGTRARELDRLLVAGNTVMQHIFAGLDPSSIATAPFCPQTLFETPKGSDAIRYAPCVSGYIGGDTVAGLLASGLLQQPGPSLYLDIGTNGEMALCDGERFLCCSVAAGPAFEGAGLACGMTATAGAVSQVRLEGSSLHLTVIGGGFPRGICGSGLIELAALLRRLGIIDATGLLLPPGEAPAPYRAMMGEDENGNGIFYLTPDRSVFLTAGDVRKLQLAKGAVAAGIRVLLDKSGIRTDQIRRLSLAGGFGAYLNLRSAAALGMIPASMAHKTVLLGNASLAGARAALLHAGSYGGLFEIQKRCRTLELSGDPAFQDAFLEALAFPENLTTYR